MTLEHRLDHLIRTGWQVIESDFDSDAFIEWRKSAVDCLMALVGPHHMYTRHFRDHVRRAASRSVLTGRGILIAAKEEAESGRLERNGRWTDESSPLAS